MKKQHIVLKGRKNKGERERVERENKKRKEGKGWRSKWIVCVRQEKNGKEKGNKKKREIVIDDGQISEVNLFIAVTANTTSIVNLT